MTDDQPGLVPESPEIQPTDTVKTVDAEPQPAPRSPEELMEIAAQAQKLAEKDTPTQGCCITLMLARQLYYAALQSLRERMEELKHTPEDGVEAHLVASMAEAAKDRPFTYEDVVQKIQAHTLPWLTAVIHSAKEEERRQQRQEDLDREEIRRLTPISLGFRHGREDNPGVQELARDRTLVLVGPAGAVHYLLNLAAQNLTDSGNRLPDGRWVHTLRLSLSNDHGNEKKRSGYVFRDVPYSQWANKLTNPKQTQKALAPFVQGMRKMLVDLLIVRDLAQVMPPTLHGASSVRTAGHALRPIRRWANEAGCAVLAGLPLGRRCEIPERGTDKDFEDLETYSDLSVVAVQEGPYDPDYEWDTYTILINGLPAIERVGRHYIDGGKPTCQTKTKNMTF